MIGSQDILKLIKETVLKTEPGVSVILYGSFARGDNHDDSDIDVLLLVDRDTITTQDKNRLTTPLYRLGIHTGTFISSLVYTRKAWQNHRVTPFYENVNREGREL